MKPHVFKPFVIPPIINKNINTAIVVEPDELPRAKNGDNNHLPNEIPSQFRVKVNT